MKFLGFNRDLTLNVASFSYSLHFVRFRNINI